MLAAFAADSQAAAAAIRSPVSSLAVTVGSPQRRSSDCRCHGHVSKGGCKRILPSDAHLAQLYALALLLMTCDGALCNVQPCGA